MRKNTLVNFLITDIKKMDELQVGDLIFDGTYVVEVIQQGTHDEYIQKEIPFLIGNSGCVVLRSIFNIPE